jgi:hypothetical protein
VAQDEPFDELLGRRIADRFLYDGRFASFGLAHQIDRLLNRRTPSHTRGEGIFPILIFLTLFQCFA